MALSTVYRVVTRYETDTGRAENRLSRLVQKTDRLARQSDVLKAKFEGMFRFASRAAVGFGTIGLGLVSRHALKLAKDMDDAKLSIASAFSLQGMGTFKGNLKDTEKLLKQFQKKAITSPGDSSQFRSISRALSPAFAGAGIGVSGQGNRDLITQFTSRAVGAAFSQMGGDVQTTQMQLLQMLQGRGGSDLALFNILKNPLAKQLGVDNSAESLNAIAKNDPRKFFDALNASLSGFDEANEEFANSFTGLWASIQETLNNTLLTAAGPLFEAMKDGFRDTLAWAEANETQINAFAESVGDKLANGWKLAGATIKMVRENLEVVVALLGAVIARKAGLAIASAFAPGGIGRGAGSFLATNIASGMGRGRQLGRGIKGGALAAGGFGLDFLGEAMFGFLGSGTGGGKGGAAARAIKGAPGKMKAAAIAQWMGRGITFDTLGAGATRLGGAVMGGAGAAKGAALAALGTGLSGLLTIVLPLVIVVGMLVGTFQVLKDKTNEATQFLMTSWNELTQALDVLAKQFGMEGGFVGAIKDAWSSLTTWLGTGVVGVFGVVVERVERVVTAFSLMVAVFKGFALGIGELINRVQGPEGLGALTKVPEIFGRHIEQQLAQPDQLMRDVMGAQQRRDTLSARGVGDTGQALSEKQMRMRAQRENREKELKKKAPKPPNINVVINQEIKTDANPDRIALRTRDILEKSLFRDKRAAPIFGGS